MPHVNFNPNTIDWRPFFAEPQVGGAYFKGRPYMRGTGIGALFSSIYRFLLPLAKSIGHEVGREGLSVGAKVIGDIAKGEEPKKALSTHSREGLRNLMAKASEKLEPQKGSGKGRRSTKSPQKGRSVQVHTYRTVLPKRKHNSTHSRLDPFNGRSLSEPRLKKRKRTKQRFDSLGPY